MYIYLVCSPQHHSKQPNPLYLKSSYPDWKLGVEHKHKCANVPRNMTYWWFLLRNSEIKNNVSHTADEYERFLVTLVFIPRFRIYSSSFNVNRYRHLQNKYHNYRKKNFFLFSILKISVVHKNWWLLILYSLIWILEESSPAGGQWKYEKYVALQWQNF